MHHVVDDIVGADFHHLLIGMISVGTGGHCRQNRLLVVAVSSLLFLVLLLNSGASEKRGGRWRPIQIFLDVSAATAAATGLIDQIVTFLVPQVLLALLVAP